MLGLGLLIAAAAGAAIAAGAVGGGLVAVRLFVSSEEREATVNLAEAFWFSVGAVVGLVASLLVVIGIGNVISAHLNSTSDDTMGSGRDWRP
jgi:hypothetical protein